MSLLENDHIHKADFLPKETLVKGFIQAVLICLLLFTGMLLLLKNYIIATIAGLYILFFFCCYWLFIKRKLDYILTAKLILYTTALLVLPAALYFSNGIRSSIAPWYVAVPVASMLIFGRGKTTNSFVALALIFFFIFGFAGFFQFSLDTKYPEQGDPGLRFMLSNIILLFITLSLTRIFESQINRALKRAGREQRLLAKYSEQLPGMIFQFYRTAPSKLVFTYVSQGCRLLLGEDPQTILQFPELITKKIKNPADPGLIFGKLDVAEKEMSVVNFEMELRHYDGSLRWVRGTAQPEKNEAGVVQWYGYAYDFTEEKKVNEDLLQKEETFSQIVNTISDVFFVYDNKSKKYLFISPNCRKVLGADPEFFYGGKNYTEQFVHPEDRHMLEACLHNASLGISYELDYRVVINGETRWLNKKSYPVYGKESEVFKLSGSITDITERKEAEESLRKSEYKFRDIFENTDELIQSIDLASGKFNYVNPAWLKTFGYTEQEVAALNFKDLVDPASHEACAEMFKKVSAGNAIENVEIIFNNKKGEKVYLEGQAGVILKDGQPDSSRGLFRNITTKKLAEEELLKTQSNLKEAQRLAHIGNWEYNFATQTLDGSKEVNRIFELDDAAEKRNLFSEVKLRIHKKDQAILDQAIKRSLEKEEVNSFEMRIHTRAGKLKYLQIICELVKVPGHKNNISLKGTVQDITTQKMAMLAKSDFLSTMSHEIRTPINGVIGIANLLLDENLTAVQKEYVSTLNFSAQHLLTIVSDILDFSKIESGHITLEKSSFNLEQVCLNIFKLFQARADEKKLEYIFKPVKVSEYSLYGDYVRLSQVLSNLVSNAIKFTESGRVEFGYDILKDQRDTVTVRFYVKDTGIGIPASKTEKIFESFSQVDGTVTRNFGGTGLGLTISKKLVEMQGGKVYVESTEGKGSEFMVELDFDKHSYTGVPVDYRKAEHPETNAFPGMRVLVAEDNRINGMVITKFLQKWSVQVTLAEDGSKALEMLRNNNYDAVLMDLQMPVMDGREAAYAIREMNDISKREIPIIALTADAMLESQKTLLAGGFNDFVTKPFSPELLFKTLKKYYSGRQIANAS
ncbi:MAG: PAS domain S-box protein [Ferruginibacter sp.]